MRSWLKFKILALASPLALASAAAAQAADLPVIPAASPVSPWAGFYAGSILGYGFGSYHASEAAGASATGWGATTGALMGYDFQSGPVVFGPEGDITLNAMRAKIPGGAGLAPTIADTIDTSRIRVRLGYDLGQALPFIAAGAAFADVYQLGNPLTQFGERRELAGFTLGAGVDWRFLAPILGPVTLRGEYVFDSYPSASFNVPGGPVRTRSANQIFRLALISYPDANWNGANYGDKVDWSGAYGGVLGSEIWAKPRTSMNGVSTKTLANGLAFGLFSGYNFTFGNVVLGVEGATELANVRGSGPQPAIADASFHDYFETDLRGRAGYAFGRLLPYVTAGLVFGRSEQIDGASGSDVSKVPSSGFTTGAGLEYMLTDRWSVRGEYLFDRSYENQTTNLDGLPLSQSLSEQKIRIGLAYYFH